MKLRFAHLRTLLLGLAGAVLLAHAADAAEVRVMISGGLSAAYNALVPEFERLTGNKVITAYGPSMGTTVNAIPVRLQRGEPADVLIMVGYALADLARQGKVVAGSSVDLVKSPIGVAVKSGAPKPDIGSAEAVKRALLAARIHRLFRQRQRRLCLDRNVRQARHCRGHEGQGAQDSGRPRSAKSSRAARPRSACSRSAS